MRVFKLNKNIFINPIHSPVLASILRVRIPLYFICFVSKITQMIILSVYEDEIKVQIDEHENTISKFIRYAVLCFYCVGAMCSAALLGASYVSM